LEFENKIKELMELIVQTLERRLSDESSRKTPFTLTTVIFYAVRARTANQDILMCPMV